MGLSGIGCFTNFYYGPKLGWYSKPKSFYNDFHLWIYSNGF